MDMRASWGPGGVLGEHLRYSPRSQGEGPGLRGASASLQIQWTPGCPQLLGNETSGIQVKPGGGWNVVQMQLLTFPPLPWRARVLALTFPVCTFSPLPSATLSTTICMVLCVLPVLYSPAACSSRFPQHSHMYPIDMCILVSFIHSFILPSSLLYSIPLHCCATVYPFS